MADTRAQREGGTPGRKPGFPSRRARGSGLEKHRTDLWGLADAREGFLGRTGGRGLGKRPKKGGGTEVGRFVCLPDQLKM